MTHVICQIKHYSIKTILLYSVYLVHSSITKGDSYFNKNYIDRLKNKILEDK